MSEYLRNLGSKATVNDVFHDLYAKVETIVEELDGHRTRDRASGTSQKDVPGTELEFNWSSGRGDDNSTDASTYISARGGWSIVNLVSISSRRVGGRDTNPERSRVRGWRQHELSADYTFCSRAGLIECSLGGLGVRGTMVKITEPIGKTLFDPTKAIGELMGVDRHRLDITAQGVLDNITAVELIKDGQKAVDVLAAMGRKFKDY